MFYKCTSCFVAEALIRPYKCTFPERQTGSQLACDTETEAKTKQRNFCFVQVLLYDRNIEIHIGSYYILHFSSFSEHPWVSHRISFAFLAAGHWKLAPEQALCFCVCCFPSSDQANPLVRVVSLTLVNICCMFFNINLPSMYVF